MLFDFDTYLMMFSILQRMERHILTEMKRANFNDKELSVRFSGVIKIRAKIGRILNM